MPDELRNPKIPEFADIPDGYKKADDYAHRIKFESSLSKAFQDLRDRFGSKHDKASTHVCQLELEAQEFVFFEGQAKPKYGNFPNLAAYSDDDLNYLKGRLTACSNATLKARYAHILWESKAKHIDFAKAAIDSYIMSIDDVRKFENETPKKTRGHRIEQSFENLWALSKSVKYRVDDAIALGRDIFLNYDFGNPSSSMIRLSLLTRALTEWKTLGAALLTDVESVFLQQKAKMNILLAMEWLLVLGQVDNKSKLTKINWKVDLAKTYEDIGDGYNQVKNPGAAAEHFRKALEVQKALKNTAQVAILEQKYDDARKAIKFGSYGQTVDLTDRANLAAKIAKKIIAEQKDAIFSYLRDSMHTFLPKSVAIREENESMLQQFYLQRNMHQGVVDHRGNVVQHFDTPEEISHYWELKTYDGHLECGTVLLLRAIFLYGIEAGVITPGLIKKFLESETWLSAKRSAWSPAVQTDESFVTLVLPSLSYFVIQTHLAVNDQKFQPDFVLCTDSLTVKIEGLLRELCEQNNEKTFYLKDDGPTRQVVFERDINHLLYTNTIKAVFSEDELMFLRFIFIEKAGANLRHKVAHSLTYVPEYSFNQMVLLVCAVLIIARKTVPKV